MQKSTYFSIIITLLFSSVSFSQALVLDPTFDTGVGIEDNFVLATAIQSNDKVIIGGAFNSFNGNAVGSIVRTNPDGSIDNSFNTGIGFKTSHVNAIAIQNNGKILVGGRFNKYNGVDIGKKIIRLNSDGSVDNSFDTGTGFDDAVETIVLSPNGEIFVGGDFTTYKGTRVDGIAKINPDGTLDTSFDTNPVGYINLPEIEAIAVQSDGKVVAGGEFTKFDGVTLGNIVRFNTDGTVDNTFNTGTGFNKRVEEITIQDDGKILIGGRFDDYNGTSSTRIIRLNTDGSVDNSFNTGTGFSNTAQEIVIQDDGKILVGGWFASYNEEAAKRLIRLNTDGTRDNSFNIGAGFDSPVESIIILNDKRTLVGGWFESYNGTPVGRIVRLMTGPLDLNKESLADNIKMYPNPTSDQIQISVPSTQTEVHIIDLNGELVFSKVLNNKNEIITTNDIPNGIYNVQFIHNNGMTNKKLVVNR